MAKRDLIQVGDKAPDFTLPSATGELFQLSRALRERPVVLFFYPKDESSGCTVEACTFRDRWDEFLAAGVEVVGVSADPLDSHRSFASKHKLPMRLLTDEGGRVTAAYGIPRTLLLLPGRVTFVIAQSGVVVHAYSSLFQAKRHVDEALSALSRVKDAAAPAAL